MHRNINKQLLPHFPKTINNNPNQNTKGQKIRADKQKMTNWKSFVFIIPLVLRCHDSSFPSTSQNLVEFFIFFYSKVDMFIGTMNNGVSTVPCGRNSSTIAIPNNHRALTITFIKNTLQTSQNRKTKTFNETLDGVYHNKTQIR